MPSQHSRLVAAVGLLIALSSTTLAGQQNLGPPSPPNVILILMDDMGYADLGSYGGRDAKPPNVDRLAREGVRLTDAYANASNCSPTRAGFISGRYQQRYGIEWPLGSFPGDTALGLPASGMTLPALLKKSGYSTGLIGKWHLGSKPEFSPNAHGFDEFFGFLSGAVDYYTHRRGDGTPDLYENDKPVEEHGYLTDEITRRAVSFVDRHANGPFFLEVAYNAVHWPFEPPNMPNAESHQPPRPRASGDATLYQGPDDVPPATRSDYVRMLERADLGVGEILATLERRGLTKNTLVIFTNDNGGEWLSHNDPLSNRKSTLWEGGIRVPMILRWPGHIPAHTTSKQVAITMDLTASILGLAGATVPPTYKLDGTNILPAVTGKSPIIERQLYWRWRGPPPQTAVRFGRWKLLHNGRDFYLFDVSADPGERHDLTAEHPDLVQKLAAMIDAWQKDVDAGPTR